MMQIFRSECSAMASLWNKRAQRLWMVSALRLLGKGQTSLQWPERELGPISRNAGAPVENLQA